MKRAAATGNTCWPSPSSSPRGTLRRNPGRRSGREAGLWQKKAAVGQPDGGSGWEDAGGRNLEPKGDNGGSGEDRREVAEGSEGVAMKRRLGGGRQRRPGPCRRPHRAKRSPFAGVCPSSFGFGTKPETREDSLLNSLFGYTCNSCGSFNTYN